MIKNTPKKWKYNRIFDLTVKSSNVQYGTLQYLQYGLVVTKDIECFYEQLFAAFKVLKKFFKKRAYIKFNVSLSTPYTKKSVSSRMGKGKGQRKGFKAHVKKGTVLLELGNVSNKEGYIALNQCKLRLPGFCKIVKYSI